MKVLELFAGSRSIGKACEELGYEVYSSDINPFPGIDYVTDIRDFDVDKVPFVPDIIWASPPCTYFSVASIGKHWNKDNTPKSDNAINLNWKPKTMCKNGMPCHVSAPRGSQTGTQGMKGNYERSKIPHELCIEVLK